jgi:hypothetical protein
LPVLFLTIERVGAAPEVDNPLKVTATANRPEIRALVENPLFNVVADVDNELFIIPLLIPGKVPRIDAY